MFTFANPLILWAFPLLLLPWIFRRRQEERVQHIPFPLLRFLHESEEKERVNPFLQEILLLILRTLLIALLLLALAGPKWVTQQPGMSKGFMSYFPFGRSFQSHVLVLDHSYSMGYAEGENNWWRKTREAWDILENEITGLALDRIRWDRRTLESNPEQLMLLSSSEMEALLSEVPEQEGIPITELIHGLEQTFEESRNVILVTDGQRFPWRPYLQTQPQETLPHNLLVVTVGEEPVNNLWCDVESLSSPPWGIAGWETIAGKVYAMHEEGGEATVSILHEETGEPLYVKSIQYPSSRESINSQSYFFSARFTDLLPKEENVAPPEVLDFSIHLEPDDPLPLDNRLSLTVPAIDRFRYALLDQSQESQEVVTILQTAINPMRDSSQAPPIETEILTPPFDLENASPHLLLVAKTLNESWAPTQTNQVLEYVRNGGSVIVFTGAAESQDPEWEAFLEELGWLWKNEDPAVEENSLSVTGSDILAQSLSTWENEMWNPWIGERHGTLRGTPLVSYRVGDETHHLVSETVLGKGKIWLANSSLEPNGDTLLSPLLPAFLWETGKEQARDHQTYDFSIPAPSEESNLTLLTEQEKQELEDNYGIQFAELSNLREALDNLYGGTDLRLLLIFLCVVLGVTESWMSNRLASL